MFETVLLPMDANPQALDTAVKALELVQGHDSCLVLLELLDLAPDPSLLERIRSKCLPHARVLAICPWSGRHPQEAT